MRELKFIKSNARIHNERGLLKIMNEKSVLPKFKRIGKFTKLIEIISDAE